MKQIGPMEIVDQLSMADCIALMENMFAKESDSITSQPQRVLNRIDSDSIIMTMPAFSPRLSRFAVKIVSEFKRNPVDRALPAQGGIIVLIDTKSSEILATLDAPAITEIRTAAVSGLATKLLSREDSRTVGIIGSGAEARRLLEAVLVVRSGVSQVRVFSLHFANAQKFSEQMSKKLGTSVEAKSERSEAVRGADILIVATNSKNPVTRWGEISSGCHINSIGALYKEIDRQTVLNSKVFVDTKEGVMKEAPDVAEAFEDQRASENHIVADLSELVSREKKGRQSAREVTLFKSVGFGLQDVYASSFVFDKSS